jgi:hypothetical protein
MRSEFIGDSRVTRPATVTRLMVMAMAPALSAAVSMLPLGVVGAKADIGEA